MTATEILSIVVSLVSVIGSVVAIFFAFKNGKRTDTNELERRVTERTETNVKLDVISGDVREIKETSKETVRNVQALADKIAVVDAKADRAHYRIDALEKERREGHE